MAWFGDGCGHAPRQCQNMPGLRHQRIRWTTEAGSRRWMFECKAAELVNQEPQTQRTALCMCPSGGQPPRLDSKNEYAKAWESLRPQVQHSRWWWRRRRTCAIATPRHPPLRPALRTPAALLEPLGRNCSTDSAAPSSGSVAPARRACVQNRFSRRPLRTVIFIAVLPAPFSG